MTPAPLVVGLAQARIEPQPGNGRGTRSPLKFFLLVFALSIPLWLVGALTGLQLMPGLPVSALGAICPMLAALILVYREHKTAGATQLLRRSLDFRRIKAKRWYVPILLLMPGVSVLVYALMRWLDMPLPAPHVPAFEALPLQAHRSLAWIAWWCLYAVAARVLIVWIYNHAGRSVFAAAVVHAMLNLSWMLFPVYGSHFDMRLGGLVMAAAAALAAVVWRPRTQSTEAGP